MTSVCGTPVLRAGSDDPVALLLSDLHVPADGGAVMDSLRGAVAAARQLGAGIHVLGDLFDTYVARSQVRTGVWREVAELFAAATAARCAVTVLHGNRDFLLGDEFAAASGARVVAGGLRLRLGGLDTLLLHGDELCQNDLPYQRAKRWLRQPALGWVARRLPLRCALAIAERARQRSRQVVARGDQQRFLPTRAAIEAAFATGVDRLVFGHIHRFSHGPCGRGSYWVLPAFDEMATGLLVRQGTIEPVRFLDPAGRFAAVPEPGPLPGWPGERPAGS